MRQACSALLGGLLLALAACSAPPAPAPAAPVAADATPVAASPAPATPTRTAPAPDAAAPGAVDAGATGAAPAADITKPAPAAPAAPAPAAPSAREAPACRSDADCAVKDVGSCCGYKPACVHRDAKTDPAAVQARCQAEDRVGICGFREPAGCTCRAGRCEDAGTGDRADALQEIR